MSEKNIDNVIFEPGLVAKLTQESIEAERKHPEYLSIGIDPFGDKYVMARKSKVTGILGDTSQGKTSLMRFMAGKMANQIDFKNNEIGIYATWEDNVEDFGMVDFAEVSKIPVKSLYNGQITDGQFGRLMDAAITRARTPLWIIGHSEKSPERPMLTMSDIFAVCKNITEKQGKKIRFVFLDYLQRINREDTRERDTRMQFVRVMDMVKNLSLSYPSAVFIGSQVRRDMVERAGKDRQPQTHWAMETSNFEHSCDGMLSVWMPFMSKDIYKEGDSLEAKTGVDSKSIVVTRELISIEILKQKKGATGTRTYMDFLHEFGMFVKHGTAAEAREQIKKEYGDA